MIKGPRYDTRALWAAATWALTSVWLVLMMAASAETSGLDDWTKVLIYLGVEGSGPGLVHLATYVNAVALTATNMALFVLMVRAMSPRRTWLLAPVAAYGAINLLVYGVQFTLVPWLVARYSDLPRANEWLRQVVHLYPTSSAALLNALAYALLGIPAWFVGQDLASRRWYARGAGILLMGNSVACWLGLIGLLVGSSALQLGVVVGGGLFWLALMPLAWHLWRARKAVEEDSPHG